MSDADVSYSIIAQLLTELGYKAEVHGNLVRSSAGGSRFTVRTYNKQSIQFACAWGVTPEEFDLEQVNDFNARYRFATVYRDGDMVILQSSFFFDHSAAEAGPRLQQLLTLFESLMTALRSEMSEAINEDAGTNPAQ